jgi:hypothetical protein
MSVKIFLSTVSAEFRPYRDELRKDLTRQNVEVKVQDDFKDLGGLTLDKLDAYIAQCDGVVHLVGEMTGAFPGEAQTKALLAKYLDLTEKLPPLGEVLKNVSGVSYSQWEAWLALYHGKLLFIASADKIAPRAPDFAPTQDSRDAQARHLAWLAAAERFPGCTFTCPDNLTKSILATAVLDLLAQADDQSLFDLFNQNAERIVSTFDQVIETLDKSSSIKPEEAKSTIEHLQCLRGEFVKLQKKHMDALIARKHALAHDLAEEIHVLQDEAVKIIRSRVGDIGRRWYASLDREYIDAPSPEEDSEYHQVGRDLAELDKATEEAMKSWRYPGDPPPSTQADIAKQLFGEEPASAGRK